MEIVKKSEKFQLDVFFKISKSFQKKKSKKKTRPHGSPTMDWRFVLISVHGQNENDRVRIARRAADHIQDKCFGGA